MSDEQRILQELSYCPCSECPKGRRIILEEDFCEEKGEGDFCFPIEDFTASPFGNFVAAVAAASLGGCVCDAGGCGRSGMVYGGTIAYLASKLNWDPLKTYKYLESKGVSPRGHAPCPELDEQRAAIKLVYFAQEFAKKRGRDAFEFLPYVTIAYVGDEAIIAVRVDGEGGHEVTFLPILPIWGARKEAEADIFMNVNELKRIESPIVERVLENYFPVKGKVVLKRPRKVNPELYAFAKETSLALSGEVLWEE